MEGEDGHNCRTSRVLVEYNFVGKLISYLQQKTHIICTVEDILSRGWRGSLALQFHRALVSYNLATNEQCKSIVASVLEANGQPIVFNLSDDRIRYR